MLIQICHGENCVDNGGKALAEALQERGVVFETMTCRSLCPYAPVVMVEQRLRLRIQAPEIQAMVDAAC